MSANLADALTLAAEKLGTASDTPRLDASILLCHVLDCPRSFLLSHPETILGAGQAGNFESLVSRRSRGEPVAYITGVKEFWSLDLIVTPDVLVPRPETETLVEAALERLPPDMATRIADLGTGSGAIALALASERPRARVLATDISPTALAIARKNAERHGLGNVEFRIGAWCSPLGAERFDVIVSNPPYVAEGDPHLAALAHEPQLALVAPEHGIADLHQIIREAPAQLLPGGWLLLEHGADQGDAVNKLLVSAGFAEVQTLTDLSGLPRVSIGRLLRSVTPA